jgi:CRISPR-associated protein Csb3
MTQITLAGCEPYTLLSHMALYGLGAILEADGAHDVRLGWSTPANPRPVISTGDTDEAELAARIGQHAEAHAAADSWVQRDSTLTVRSQDKPKPAVKALMSPRWSSVPAKMCWTGLAPPSAGWT